MAPDLPEVFSDSEAVRHGAEPVLEVLEVVFKLGWVVGVGDDTCNIKIGDDSCKIKIYCEFVAKGK